MTASFNASTACRHCHRRKASRPRGLCWGCYYKPGVRDRYPSSSKFGARYPEPKSLAEVDAIIAEQMKCLPRWWHAESRKAAGEIGRLMAGRMLVARSA